jgi:uncharacterized protein (DUF1778 family)
MEIIKEQSLKKEKVARFDTRITLEQKRLFEKAAALSGFRDLTSFIIVTVQERAHQIIQQQEQILASNRDSDLFFEALLNPPLANIDLLEAIQDYKNQFLQ